MCPSPVIICPVWPLSSPSLLPYVRPYSPILTPSVASSAPRHNIFCPVVLGFAAITNWVAVGAEAPFNLQQVAPWPPYIPVLHLIPNSDPCLSSQILLNCTFFADFWLALRTVPKKVLLYLSVPACFSSSLPPITTDPPALAGS